MANQFNIPGLKESIADISKLNDSVNETAKNLLTMAINAEKALRSTSNNGGLKDFTELQKKANETQKETSSLADILVKKEKQLADAKSDLGKKIATATLEIQKQNAENKANAQIIDLNSDALKKEVTSINEARAQNILLTQARNGVNLATTEGQLKLAEFNAKLDTNNKFIKENGDAALKQKMNIGAYSEGIQNALEKTGLMSGKLGDLARTAIGFVQVGAQAVQKVKDLNANVITGAKNIGAYIAAKLGFQQAEKAGTVATNAATLATVENTVATEESTVANEALTVATEGTAVAEGTATVATSALNVAIGILLAPVTLLLVGLALLVFIFKDFAPLINPIKDAFASLGAIWDVMKQSIFDLVTGARSLTEIFSGLAGAMSGAAKEAKELAQAQRDLSKAQDINTVANAQAQTEIQKLILQSKNRTLSEKERIDLIQKAQDIEVAAFKKTNDLNNEAIRIARAKLFEGKNLSDEEKKAIESNDFAKIRSLKISKNLNEEELKSYQDLLLKKEELVQKDQQIMEKAQNRKEQNEDKAIEKAQKEREDAQKAHEKAQQEAEKRAKAEADRQNKSMDIAINYQKNTLDYIISSYKQEENIESENVAHIKTISLQKQSIADLELKKAKIGVTDKLDLKALESDAETKKNKIIFEETKALEKLQSDNSKFELALYKEKNKSLLDGEKSLTQLLLGEERLRLQKTFDLEKAELKKELNIDEEKLKSKQKLNQELTTAEKKFIQGIEKLQKEKADGEKKIEKVSTDIQLKAINDKSVAEQRALNLSSKSGIKKQKEEFKIKDEKLKKEKVVLKAQEKLLQEGTKEYDENKKTQDQIDYDSAENQKKIDDEVKKSKAEGLQDSLSLFIDIMGKESAAGKAAGIAQASINTYTGATKALADYEYPMGGIVAGLVIAQGLMTVAKIAGIQMFEVGTMNAPYTGKAIVDEAGAEIHTDANGNIKSMGENTGARITDIVKGDKIIPADISAIIKSTMFSGSMFQYEGKAQTIDYDKMGEQMDKYFGKHTSKIVNAVNSNGKNQLTVNVQRNIMDRVTFKGKRV
jgi:hypothetical protein